MTIGQKITYLRQLNGLSQAELADKLGIRKQTIYKYEKGIVDNLPIERVAQLADALGTTPAYLMGWTEEEKPIPQDELSTVKTELIDLIKSLSEEECRAVLRILKR